MRKTKIICTMGPAVDSDEAIRALIGGGMDCARFNFSHGSHEEQKARMDRVKRISAEMNVPVALLLDTKGPEIRLKDFEEGSVVLEPGQTFALTASSEPGTAEGIGLSYPHLAAAVTIGTRILIDDGKIAMFVERIEGSSVICRVINGGKVSNRKSIHNSGQHTNLVRPGSFHITAGTAAPEISATHYDSNFCAQVMSILDVPAYFQNCGIVQAKTFIAGQGFTAQLNQNPLIFYRHNSYSVYTLFYNILLYFMYKVKDIMVLSDKIVIMYKNEKAAKTALSVGIKHQ